MEGSRLQINSATRRTRRILNKMLSMSPCRQTRKWSKFHVLPGDAPRPNPFKPKRGFSTFCLREANSKRGLPKPLQAVSNLLLYIYITNNTFLLVTTTIVNSRLFEGGQGLMFHSELEDNEDVLVCTLEGVLKHIGRFRFQKDRRYIN